MKASRFLFAAFVSSILAACGACEKEPQGVPSRPVPSATGRPGTIKIEYQVLPSILLEAESGKVEAPMEVRADSSASAGTYVLTPAVEPHGLVHTHLHKEGEGRAALRFKPTAEGDYAIWFRAKYCCACGNSANVFLDGASLGTVEDSVYEAWHWVRLSRPPLRLSAADHLLLIVNREDGAGIDQVLLTQDPDYRPTGIESPDAPGRTSGLPEPPPATAAPPAPKQP